MSVCDVCGREVRVRAGDRVLVASGVSTWLLVSARYSRSPGATVCHQLRQASTLLRLQRPLVDAVRTVLVHLRSILQGCFTLNSGISCFQDEAPISLHKRSSNTHQTYIKHSSNRFKCIDCSGIARRAHIKHAAILNFIYCS